MKQFLLVILVALCTLAATAQNQVVVEHDSVYVVSHEGQRVPISSAEIRARVDDYSARRKDLDGLLALYERLTAMKEQSLRLRDEVDALNNLLKQVSDAEAKIPKK